MRAFVAVVEEGGLSAAARRLHMSQSALSQTIAALERQLGAQLLTRSSTGTQATDIGMVLLVEARAVLARHDQALAAITQRAAAGDSVLRLGVPLELPQDLLTGPVADLAAAYPHTRLQARHLSTAAQFTALSAGELDVGLVREHPIGTDLDATLVVEECLGVLIAADTDLGTGTEGIRLDTLAGLDWVGFPRSGSPAWYDEVVAIFRSHGIELGAAAPEGQTLIPEVKFAAVAAGYAFTLAPPDWPHPLPDSVRWHPLIGHPLIRRTWVTWPAASHRRDLGQFILSLEKDASAKTYSSPRANTRDLQTDNRPQSIR